MTDERTIFDEVEEAAAKPLPWTRSQAEAYAVLTANNAPAFVTALRAAEVALRDLGACDEIGCADPNCNHALRLIAAAKRGEANDG